MTDTLLDMAEGRSMPDGEGLARLEAEYPYCVYPAVAMLRDGNADAELRRHLRRRVAAAVSDAEALGRILGGDPAEFDDFYPDMRGGRMSTSDTIDAFLDRFGTPAAASAVRHDAAAALDVTPAIDYASMLLADEGADAVTPADGARPDATAEMLDSFLSGSTPARHAGAELPAAAPAPEAAAPAPPVPEPAGEETSAAVREPSALSESFARILIKNRSYDKALEIITALSLNNPEKSIYFADQIRFLRKLIINESKSK